MNTFQSPVVFVAVITVAGWLFGGGGPPGICCGWTLEKLSAFEIWLQLCDIVHAAGTTQVRGPHMHSSMRILEVFALVYIVRGQGIYYNESGYSHEFEPGDLLLIFPGFGHRYGPTKDEDFAEFFVAFKGPIFDLWKRSGLLDSSRPILHLQPVEFWLPKFHDLIDAPPGNAVEALQPVTRLCQLLAEIHAATSTQSLPADKTPWLAQARSMLGDNLHQPLSHQSVADQIGISYDAFRHIFRKQTGVSPARYRMNQRIAAACDLLLHTALNVKQVAEKLGFSSEFHFSQRFKEIKGVSPRRFRQRGE